MEIHQWDDPVYRDLIDRFDRTLDTDGCTGVTQIRRAACCEHDIHYRTGYAWKVVDQKLVPQARCTRTWADYRFRVVLRKMSRFGRFSPMAWWRWAGVRVLPFARNAWKRYRKEEPYAWAVKPFPFGH